MTWQLNRKTTMTTNSFIPSTYILTNSVGTKYVKFKTIENNTIFLLTSGNIWYSVK